MLVNKVGLTLDEALAMVHGQYPMWVHDALIEQYNISLEGNADEARGESEAKAIRDANAVAVREQAIAEDAGLVDDVPDDPSWFDPTEFVGTAADLFA